MRRAVQHIGAAGGEGYLAQQQGCHHHNHLWRTQRKLQFIPRHKGNQRHHRNGKRDGRQNGAEEQIHRPLHLIIEHRFQRSQAFWRQDQQGHQETGKGDRRVQFS